MTNDNQKDPLSYWQSRALNAERERDELAAHVERLRALAKESQEWNWLSAWEEAQDAGAVNLLIPEMQELVDQVDAETPAQSLHEVRAEAGREGWIMCAHWMIKAPEGSNVSRAADDYARKVRSSD